MEDDVHLLETTVCAFRAEEPDQRRDHRVQNRENNKRLPPDRIERDGRDQHHPEIVEPVRGGAQRGRGPPDLERHDLDGVQPGHALPADDKKGDEHEHEDGRGDLRGRHIGRIQRVRLAKPTHNGQHDHGSGHAGGTEHEEGAAAPELVDAHDGDEGGEGAFGGDAGGQETGHPAGVPELGEEDEGAVLHEQVDAGELLAALDEAGQDGAVEMAGLALGEDVAEGAGRGFDHGVFDGEEFLVHAGVVVIGVVEGCEDFQGFVGAAGEDEPAGRFGEEGDKHEQRDRDDQLKGDRDAPCSGRGIDVGKGEVDPVRKGGAGGEESTRDHEVGAAAMGARSFSLIGRDGGGSEAVACVLVSLRRIKMGNDGVCMYRNLR